MDDSAKLGPLATDQPRVFHYSFQCPICSKLHHRDLDPSQVTGTPKILSYAPRFPCVVFEDNAQCDFCGHTMQLEFEKLNNMVFASDPIRTARYDKYLSLREELEGRMDALSSRIQEVESGSRFQQLSEDHRDRISIRKMNAKIRELLQRLSNAERKNEIWMERYEQMLAGWRTKKLNYDRKRGNCPP